MLCILIYLAIQKQFSPKLQVCFVLPRFLSSSMEWWQISRINSSRLCSLNQNHVCTKVPKTDSDTDLSEFSNLKLCVGTGSVSPIKVSIESSTVVQEDSLRMFFFDSCNNILMSAIALKVFCFEQPRYSKKCFSVSTTLVSFIEVSMEDNHFWADV